MRTALPHLFAILGLILLGLASASPLPAQSKRFESSPVHPLALTPNGTRLLACQTDDDRLVVFDVTGSGAPTRIDEIFVGLEPVTVRPRNDLEAWVVNQVSDDISIVRLDQSNVVRTLLVGDEPTDVVFAGSPERAFVCCSQRAELRVFDLADLDAPPVLIPLGVSVPRSLAVSLDGSEIFVTAFDSGDRTTIVPFAAVDSAGGLPPPNPPMDPILPEAPVTGLIVKHDGVSWRDETGASWDAYLGYQLHDHDVVRVSTSALSVVGSFSSVGTTLFDIAVNPATGFLSVTNTQASNEIRFEPNLRGRFMSSRISTINPANGQVQSRSLNEHINYGNPAGDPVERSLSLSFPVGLAISSDGLEVYVAALGSSKVGVLDAQGTVLRRIAVGKGPSGLALDEGGNRLFVLNQIAGSLSAVDLSNDSSVEIPLGFDPTLANVKIGREIFYDGAGTSAHGDVSCASCHLFGATDNLAWDLGNPLGTFIPPPPPVNGDTLQGFHPMKGPMVTQTLQTIASSEPFHWRGDRPTLDDFNPAFVNLLGRGQPLDSSELENFTAFVFSLASAPNPYRTLNGSLPPAIGGGNPALGEQFFNTPVVEGGGACVNCHSLPNGGGPNIVPQQRVQALSSQDMAPPNLVALSKKTGFVRSGNQATRGFGMTHEGSVEKLFPHQLHLGEGRSPSSRLEPNDNDLNRPFLPVDREDLEAFLLAFDSGIHPAVGAQWTMDGTNEALGIARVNTIASIADGSLAGMIAKGRDANGDARGWTYMGAGSWISDRVLDLPATTPWLVALAGTEREITFTGVLFGTEMRLGVDRDGDGYRDRDEIDHGSDPGDPLSVPSSVGVIDGSSSTLRTSLEWLGGNPARGAARFAIAVGREGRVSVGVYDVSGRLVRRFLESMSQPVGRIEFDWPLDDDAGRALSSGVYFVRLATEADLRTRRVVVLR